jgi:mannose-1-phosphate guanylyltransferase
VDLRRLLGKTPLVPRAMLLCAGYGTRLRPLTDEVPKPLLSLGDRTLLEHAAAALAEAGLGDAVAVNVHHLAEQFERRLANFPARVTLVHEPEIRGTAGGIAGARSVLGPAPVVVMVGDVVVPRVPRELVEAAANGGLVLAVARRPVGEGTVGVGRAGRLVRLRGECFGDEVQGGDYVGIAALGAEALQALPERGCLFADYALPVLRGGGSVFTFPFLDKVVLPGDDLPSFLMANLSWLDERGLSNYLAPDARVGAGVDVAHALVGRGATIEGRGTVRDTVVLPGARCSAPLERCVVAPSGLVIKVK